MTGESVVQSSTRMSIIVPTYHGGEKLDRCLRTFCETHAGKIPYEIFTVLDAGPDVKGTAAIAEKYGATFIHLEKNSGCGYANNAGLRAASPSADCAIVMNDDIWFEEPTCLSIYKKLRSSPRMGVVGARLLYPDGTVQHAGFDARIVHVGRGLPGDHPLVLEDRPTIAVTSALMGISRKLLNVIKGFDERYRMGYEDVDLCFKARELGWDVHYCGPAWAYHDEGGTRGRVDKLMKNELWWGWNSSGHRIFFNTWSSSGEKFCHDSFTYVIQTAQLAGLEITLGNVAQQMSDRDEVLVVGPEDNDIKSLVDSFGWKFRHLSCAAQTPEGRFVLGMNRAIGSYLVFLNAGEAYTEAAVAKMKKEVQRTPLVPILFRTSSTEGKSPQDLGNLDWVTPAAILLPNCPDLFGAWEGSTADFVAGTLAKWPPNSMQLRNLVVM